MEVKKIRQVPEKVVFASFAGKLKPSFLWCQYSMLRTLVLIKKMINIIRLWLS